MRPEERDPAYLLDIVLAARAAVDYLGARDRSALEQDPLVLSAIEHQLIVLGEAARRVSEATTRRHAEIPWSKAVGMRNILVHEYGRVDVGEVARTVREDLPALIAKLEPLLPPEPSE
jgi:uncharacterized protein with HEPN domain